MPSVIHKTLNAPWHITKGFADAAGAPARAITGTQYLSDSFSTSTSSAQTVYDVANPMMDITTLIYYYTELRSATKTRLREYAISKHITYDYVRKGALSSDLETIRNAIFLVDDALAALDSATPAQASAAHKTYIQSLDGLKAIRTTYDLGEGDVQILKVYLTILREPKDMVKIKSDFELYNKYIGVFFRKSFGGKDFNLSTVIDIVERDPEMYVHCIDDDFAASMTKALQGLGSEVVYAIVVSKKQKKITVVFRGSVAPRDWLKNIKLYMTDNNLPGFTSQEAEEKDDKQTFGRVHQGFYEYLFGKTKKGDDDRTISKAEEIMGTLTGFMSQEEFKDFSIYVTGHSLGGALSTMFAFRAAAFGELPMVTNVSFASPYCGDQGFREKFYELEATKRIRHLRISNYEDAVTLLSPVSLPIPNETFKHTGMNVRLYDEDQFLKPKARLFYPKRDSLFNEVRNAVTSNLPTALSVGVVAKHLCPEYGVRLDDAAEQLKLMTLDGLYADPHITGFSYCNTYKDLNLPTIESTATGEFHNFCFVDLSFLFTIHFVHTFCSHSFVSSLYPERIETVLTQFDQV